MSPVLVGRLRRKGPEYRRRKLMTLLISLQTTSRRVALPLIAGLLVCTTAAAQTYSFTLLNYPGTTHPTVAYGINDRGQVMGVIGEAPGYTADPVGFLYEGGTYTIIEYPGSTQTWLNGLNDRGQAVGFAFVGTELIDFIYAYGVFTPIDLPGLANGMNNAGDIVGSYTDSTGTRHGYLYSGGSVQTIDVPSSPSTSAMGINDRGEIVGSYILGSTTHGFVYSAGVFTMIDYPGADSTAPTAISNNGKITGAFYPGFGPRGFIYERGSYTSFAVPESVYCVGGHEHAGTFSQGVNDRGEVTGSWFGYLADQQGAYIGEPVRGAHQGNTDSGCGK
jgi:probable HAF family extracellular repeat protein